MRAGAGAEAAELFIKEACALLRLAPLSPLAGAVLAGCRVLPALHDIRAKMAHPHVIAAWSDDELPFEVTHHPTPPNRVLSLSFIF